MGFSELFESGEHSRNISHFASILRMALVDGDFKDEEKRLLSRFARKLNITDKEYEDIVKHPSNYPLNPPSTADERLERMLDLFKMIFADNEIDEDEKRLLERYAIALGYTEPLAAKLIERSIKIFQGGLDLEDYRYLLNRR
jgi:uncharacterized tellurite resistance protein B-like protein